MDGVALLFHHGRRLLLDRDADFLCKKNPELANGSEKGGHLLRRMRCVCRRRLAPK